MVKKELHPRNRHRDRYDFKLLIQACPELAQFVAPNAYGDESIDFSNPRAVKSLNQAILKQNYHVSNWDIPNGYLCPPIPGRADYLHYAADLLAASNQGVIPRGRSVRILDIGIGANCVYPIIGQSEYGWSFVGTDIDPIALQSAARIRDLNRGLSDAVELRQQKSPSQIFEGILKPGELFDLTICNPPFHASLDEAQEVSRLKWKKLGKSPARNGTPVRNFGGMGSELCCEGGERAFVLKMIQESARFATQCHWFTTLVSRNTHVLTFRHALTETGAKQQKVIEMAQGQKTSRFIAWTFI